MINGRAGTRRVARRDHPALQISRARALTAALVADELGEEVLERRGGALGIEMYLDGAIAQQCVDQTVAEERDRICRTRQPSS